MISREFLIQRFTKILSLLLPDDIKILRGGWGKDFPIIFTDQKTIDDNPFGNVDRAATLEKAHYYRLDKFTEDEIDDAILEECAHDYYFFTKKHNFFRYWSSRTDDYRNMVEREAGQLALRWKSLIENHANYRGDDPKV